MVAKKREPKARYQVGVERAGERMWLRLQGAGAPKLVADRDRSTCFTLAKAKSWAELLQGRTWEVFS